MIRRTHFNKKESYFYIALGLVPIILFEGVGLYKLVPPFGALNGPLLTPFWGDSRQPVPAGELGCFVAAVQI